MRATSWKRASDRAASTAAGNVKVHRFQVLPHEPGHITLPDGSSRSVPAGTPVGESRRRGSRRGWPRRRWRRWWTTRRRSLVSADADASVRLITSKNPEALPLYRHSTAHLLAAAVTLFPGVQCGIGPADRRRVLLRLRRPAAVRARGPRGDREEDARARGAGSRLRAADVAAGGGQAFFGDRGEPLKVQLIEEKTEGQREVSCYTIKDRETFVDFCVGPHVPSTGKLKAFKLLTPRTPTGRATRATSRCSASTAPRSSRTRSCKHTCTGSRRRRSATTASLAGTRAVHVPPVGAGRGVLARQGHDALQPARQLHARGALPGGLHRGEDAAHLQQGAVGDVRPLAALPREHVPRRVRRTSRWASSR